MAEVALEAEVGRSTGTRPSRRLRAEGKVPAVLYGHGITPQSLTVDRKALRAALAQEAGLNALIALEVAGTRHLAMARQLQRDPLKGFVSHVDFVIVSRDEVVSVEVPVRLVGEAEAVERGDGLIEQQLFELTVHAKPADIPNAVEVDISRLTIGDAIRVSDLRLPAGVSTDLDPEDPVVLAQASRLAEEEEGEGEEEPGEAADTGTDSEG
jgi:large subunit ribosomal protein L25